MKFIEIIGFLANICNIILIVSFAISIVNIRRDLNYLMKIVLIKKMKLLNDNCDDWNKYKQEIENKKTKE